MRARRLKCYGSFKAMSDATEKYCVWIGHRHSPVHTDRDLRTFMNAVQPFEYHGRGYNEGGFAMLKTKSLKQAWIIYEYGKFHKFNLGKEGGPMKEGLAGREKAPHVDVQQDIAAILAQTQKEVPPWRMQGGQGVEPKPGQDQSVSPRLATPQPKQRADCPEPAGLGAEVEEEKKKQKKQRKETQAEPLAAAADNIGTRPQTQEEQKRKASNAAVASDDSYMAQAGQKFPEKEKKEEDCDCFFLPRCSVDLEFQGLDHKEKL